MEDMMQELLCEQTAILDDIAEVFPSEILLGIGIAQFVQEPMKAFPTVITRRLGNYHADSLSLFTRIAQVAYTSTRISCGFDPNQFPAMAYVLQDDDRRNCGMIIIAVDTAGNSFSAEDYDLDPDELTATLTDRIKKYAPNIGHVYGSLFY